MRELKNMASNKVLKQTLYDLFNKYEEADDIKEALRSLVSVGEMTDEDYNTILKNYEDWLHDWYLDEKQKHDDYDQNEEIQLSRIDEDTFRLFYEAENYEFVGSKEEVLEELSEHLDLKKF